MRSETVPHRTCLCSPWDTSTAPPGVPGLDWSGGELPRSILDPQSYNTTHSVTATTPEVHVSLIMVLHRMTSSVTEYLSTAQLLRTWVINCLPDRVLLPGVLSLDVDRLQILQHHHEVVTAGRAARLVHWPRTLQQTISNLFGSFSTSHSLIEIARHKGFFLSINCMINICKTTILNNYIKQMNVSMSTLKPAKLPPTCNIYIYIYMCVYMYIYICIYGGSWNGGSWLPGHLWCPNGPPDYGIGEGEYT